ncbi:MAG: molybdopterin-synthase adenylyltransferase MoeB [Gammaproteobacteria bacterium]|nr:molybdopterin-synthase adenylyltransferase MoeB [Gammaproteobacteria bacterium]
MNDEQLLRYSRQIMLPQFDIAGQQRLLASKVLIIGLGGLGSPVAMYLAAAGVGRLTLVDDDAVDLTNLQRQILHTQADIGRAKVESAADTLRAMNPDIEVITRQQRLSGAELHDAVQQADLVIDASDNFATRFAINQACVDTRTPLVSGAAIRMEGQVCVFLNRRPGHSPGHGPDSQDEQAACYRCLYDDIPEAAATCSENGVLSPVVGIIGSIQATEAIKLLAGIGTPLAGRLLTLDAANMEFREIRLRRDPSCPVCAGK